MKILTHPWLSVTISWIIVITIKIPHLSLPYFMDETFSYIPAIIDMVKAGPNMLPGTIPLLSAKGHPLFFYFLASIWMKFIAGNSIVIMRIFPVIISLAFLYIFHRFAKKHINIEIANIGVLLLAVQPLFLAQASLVLPELLLASLFMLCFDCYLSGKFGLYATIGSLMMLTKETGVVFILVFGLAFLIENYNQWRTKSFWQNIIFLGIPVFVYLMFLLLHYFSFGVFFFSEHLNLMSFEFANILHKLKSATWTLFLAHGRNLIFFAAFGALAILLIRNKTILYKRFLLISLLTSFAFLIFCSFNFYVYRYVLPIMGICLLMLLVFIYQIRTNSLGINLFFVAILVGNSAYNSATRFGGDDADLGYTRFLVYISKWLSTAKTRDGMIKKLQQVTTWL